MNDAQLQIVISVLNNAAGQLGDVASQLADLADEASTDASAMSDSMSAAGTSMTESVAAATSSADEHMAGMAEATATASDEMESSISSIGGKIQAVGIQAGLLGAAIVAPAALAVKAAGDQSEAFDQLSNTVKNVYAAASSPNAGYSTEIADLTAKINAEKATISESEASLTKWNGTTAEVAAAHEKASASITTAQIDIQKLQQQLDQLTQSQQLVGGSVADTTAKFEAAARASTSFGFNIPASAQALQFLFASTNNVNETMSAYQDAMDLSAAKGIDLQTAANAVIQGMSGQGRALRDLGINVADGLSGQTALAAIQQKVAGGAEEAATHGLGPYNVAMAQLNAAMAQFGTTVLPILATFFDALSKIITAVADWAQAHPKLAEALVIFLGILGGILIVLAPILTFIGFMVITIEAVTTATDVLGITMLWLLGSFALVAAAVVTVIAVLALIIVFHQQLWTAAKTTWAELVNLFQNAVEGWHDLFTSFGSWLSSMWTGLWNGVLSFISQIWSSIGDAVQKGISSIEGIINGFATTIQNTYKTIMAPINAIIGAASSVGGAVGNVIGGTIKAFASGGIVTGPTLALVGEAGPEAIIPLSAFDGGSSLGGGRSGSVGASIVVNINGGNYLDSNGANMIANALARQIGVQLRMKNYA